MSNFLSETSGQNQERTPSYPLCALSSYTNICFYYSSWILSAEFYGNANWLQADA